MQRIKFTKKDEEYEFFVDDTFFVDDRLAKVLKREGFDHKMEKIEETTRMNIISFFNM